MTAMPEELAPLLARVEERKRVGESPPAYEARLSGAPVVLASTGDGSRRAGPALGELVRRHRPAAWIGAGFAGALTPGIPVGTLLVSRSQGDEVWASRVLESGGALPARFTTLEGVAATPEEKAAILEARGVSGGDVAAVDTESDAWLEAAAVLGAAIPALLVRVVSDAADEGIPDIVARASVGGGGGIDRRRIAFRALARPWTVGKLIAMRRRARFCAERLAGFLAGLASRGFMRT